MTSEERFLPLRRVDAVNCLARKGHPQREQGNTSCRHRPRSPRLRRSRPRRPNRASGSAAQIRPRHQHGYVPQAGSPDGASRRTSTPSDTQSVRRARRPAVPRSGARYAAACRRRRPSVRYPDYEPHTTWRIEPATKSSPAIRYSRRDMASKAAWRGLHPLLALRGVDRAPGPTPRQALCSLRSANFVSMTPCLPISRYRPIFTACSMGRSGPSSPIRWPTRSRCRCRR
jgi:hypothetical protein